MVDAIAQAAKPISASAHDQIAYVAANSAADPVVGDRIADALKKVGNEGVITVEDSQTFGVELEFTEGMQFDKGYNLAVLHHGHGSPGGRSRRCVRPDCQPEDHGGAGSASRAREGDAERASRFWSSLRMSRARLWPRSSSTRSAVRSRPWPSRAPGFGERRKAMLQDIAVLTGAQVISEEVGLKLDGVTLDLLGKARKIVVSKDDTTIVEGGGSRSDVDGRIAQIRKEIENSDSDWDREKLSERLAKLSGGVAVIKVGAATEVELKERKHRIEDAIQATRAAVEEGIVPGGGVALLRARDAIKQRGGIG